MDMWLLLVLMSLATYRVTRLVVDDTLPLVLWVRDRLAGGWREPTSKEQHHDAFPRGDVEEGVLRHVDGLGMFTLAEGELQIYRRRSRWSPQWLADLLSCPFCASGWIAAGVTSGVWAWLSLSVPLLVLLWVSAWALGGLLAAQEWS